ncbi:ATP-binding protein [Aeromonas enterica]
MTMQQHDISQIGYVVSLEGTKIRMNILEGHKGQLASHRVGVNSVSQPGDIIGFEAGRNLIVARVSDMSFIEPEKAHAANIGTMNTSGVPLRQIICHAIGYIKSGVNNLEFISENWMLPPLGAKAIPLDRNHLNVVFGLDQDDKRHSIKLGYDSRTSSIEIRANLNKILSRHLAVLGSTGYGKSNFNALITRQIAQNFPNSRIVIFDINGEYAQAFEGLPRVKQTILGEGVNNHQKGPFKKEYATFHKIPYQALGWAGLIKLLRPSDKTQLPALRNALKCLTMVKAIDNHQGDMLIQQQDGLTFTLYDDCRPFGQEHLGSWLNALRCRNVKTQPTWPPFRALATLVAEFGCVTAARNANTTERNPFNYGNVLPLIKIIQQLSEDTRFKTVINTNGGETTNNVSADHWADPINIEVNNIFGLPRGEPQDWNVHIINLKNLADDLSPMILGALLEMYAEVIFKRGQDKNYPTLLLLEEAHQYLRDPYAEDDNRLKAYERLAKEGRKFSCSLLVSTQRPSELSPTVLAMCSNWISLRLTNERDLISLRYAIENGNEHLLKEVSGLPRGDAIGFGSAFNLPIRFSIDKSEPGPASTDADFSSLWSCPSPPMGLTIGAPYKPPHNQ